MAVFSTQLSRNHTRPASRGTCRATAVTPQPSRFPSKSPAPYGRGVGCRGSPPAREPWHLSCHGGNSAAKPFSLEKSRALWARCGVQGVTPCPRAARPVAERRPWGRKRRKREALRRAFPERLAFLYSPARPSGRAVRGAGVLPLPAPAICSWIRDRKRLPCPGSFRNPCPDSSPCPPFRPRC